MAHYNFNLRQTKLEKPTSINLVVRWSNNRVVIPTGESILPKYWETDKSKKNFQRAKPIKQFPEHPEFNTRLENIIITAKDVFRKYLNDNNQSEPSKAMYHELLKEALGKGGKIDKYENLLCFYAAYLKELNLKVNRQTNRQISPKTIESHTRTFTLLEDYKNTHKIRIDYDTITLSFYYDFCRFMKEERSFSNNTLGKHIKNLKTLLNSATERGYNSNLAYKSRDFHIIKEESASIYLSETELQELYNLDLSSNKRLERVRDLFLIGCYTGLRYSDFSHINVASIDGDFLTIKTQKTNENVVIPIFPIVRSIIKKYEGKLPPSLSNQKMNEYLKELGAQVNSLGVQINRINKKYNITGKDKVPKYSLLTTHTARRSFATNMYNRGIPSITIMAITGHKTEAEFLKYIKVTPREHAKKMLQYWREHEGLEQVG